MSNFAKMQPDMTSRTKWSYLTNERSQRLKNFRLSGKKIKMQLWKNQLFISNCVAVQLRKTTWEWYPPRCGRGLKQTFPNKSGLNFVLWRESVNCRQFQTLRGYLSLVLYAPLSRWKFRIRKIIVRVGASKTPMTCFCTHSSPLEQITCVKVKRVKITRKELWVTSEILTALLKF